MPASRRVAFIALPSCSGFVLAAAIEPLFIANWLGAHEAYRWSVLSLDGRDVVASNGRAIGVDGAIDHVGDVDAIFVLASFEPKAWAGDRRLIRCLQRAARRGVDVVGVETGGEALARAGLLAERLATVHWDNLDAFKETFGAIRTREQLFTVDRGVCTCAGGTATLDMMLWYIARDHGHDLAQDISEHLLHGAARRPDHPQRQAVPTAPSVPDPVVANAIAAMEAALEEPVASASVAARVGLSLRQLERRFVRALGVTPARYYLALRLRRAPNLLQQSDLRVTEIAFATGFVSLEHFSRCYKSHFGATPSQDRRQAVSSPVPRRRGREVASRGDVRSSRGSGG
jgi:AraC family carnitine catabolism transcriptional activator